MAYRQLTGWCWGWLGRRMRVTLPSCAVNKIRTKFPVSDGNYTGFKYPTVAFTPWCSILKSFSVHLYYSGQRYCIVLYIHVLWLLRQLQVTQIYFCDLIAVGLSGISNWLLRGAGVLLGSVSMTRSLQRLKVSFRRSSTYSISRNNNIMKHPHTQYNVLTVSWVDCDLPYNVSSFLVLWI